MTSSATLQCSPINIPMVGPLSVQLAVVEIVEMMVQKLREKHVDKAWHQLIGTLKVKVKTIGLNTGGDQAWFCVRVKCTGLDISDIQLEGMLDVPNSGLTNIILQMQKLFPGSFLWLESAYLEENSRTLLWHRLDTATHEVVVHEEKLRISGRSHVTASAKAGYREVSCCWKMVQSKEHMVSECEAICSYLHKLKLLTSESNVHFFLNMWGVLTSSKFEWNSNKSTIGQKKVAVDIQHYLGSENVPEGVRKIFPKIGTSYTMPRIRVRGSDVTVKISSLAALVPPPKASEIGIRQLNEKCNRLEILFYGPGSIPLLCQAPKETGVCPTTILKLDEYGLILDEIVHEPLEAQEVVTADWVYKLKPACETLDERMLEWDVTEEQERDVQKYTILVIVMIDQLRADESSFDVLHVLQSLRHSFVQVLCKHRIKVRKAIGTALNKLLLNFTKEDQKQEQYQTAISTVSSSISRLVMASTNQSFKDACCSALNVDTPSELKASLQRGMWDIAIEKYDLTPTIAPSSGETTTCTSTKTGSRKRPAPSSSLANKRAEPDGFDELAKACAPVGGSHLDESTGEVSAVGFTLPMRNNSTNPGVVNAESMTSFSGSPRESMAPRSIDDSAKSIVRSSFGRPISNFPLHSAQGAATLDLTDNTQLAMTSDILPDLGDFENWDLPISSPTLPSAKQSQSTGFHTWIDKQNCSGDLSRTMDDPVCASAGVSTYQALAEHLQDEMPPSDVDENGDPLLGQSRASGNDSFEDWLLNLSNWD